jgi:hypothetical protein
VDAHCITRDGEHNNAVVREREVLHCPAGPVTSGY